MHGFTFTCLGCGRSWWQTHFKAYACVYCPSKDIRPVTPLSEEVTR